MPRFPTARRDPSTGKQVALIFLVITSVILVVSLTACAGIGWYVFSAVSTGIGNYNQKSSAQDSAYRFMQLLKNGQPDTAYDSASADFRSHYSREEWSKLFAQFPSFQDVKPISHNSVDGEAPHRTFAVIYQCYTPYQPIPVADPKSKSEPETGVPNERKSYSCTINLVEESEGVWKVQRFTVSRNP